MARSRQNLSWIRSSYSLHASVHLYSFPLEGDPSPAPSARFSDEVHVCTRRAMDVDIRGLSLPSASSTSGFSCGSDAGCCTSSWWSCPSGLRCILRPPSTPPMLSVRFISRKVVFTLFLVARFILNCMPSLTPFLQIDYFHRIALDFIENSLQIPRFSLPYSL
ncbi:uncharacterized protein [Triticum aestivum]|uniref:uncharacterized protein isoform X2 n=1 Tax=Triticum aestivum TaxID=4565 RepID=UPI001D010E95|nr:uncharacterized protein LOC123048625 isoform X2 [Triticum aestivum]